MVTQCTFLKNELVQFSAGDPIKQTSSALNPYTELQSPRCNEMSCPLLAGQKFFLFSEVAGLQSCDQYSIGPSKQRYCQVPVCTLPLLPVLSGSEHPGCGVERLPEWLCTDFPHRTLSHRETLSASKIFSSRQLACGLTLDGGCIGMRWLSFRMENRIGRSQKTF